MPLYYFDISQGGDIDDIEDDEGHELEGLNAARIEAVRLSGQLLKDYPTASGALASGIAPSGMRTG